MCVHIVHLVHLLSGYHTTSATLEVIWPNKVGLPLAKLTTAGSSFATVGLATVGLTPAGFHCMLRPTAILLHLGS